MQERDLDTKFKKYPKPAVTFTYGTAGFRTQGNHLPFVLLTVGILAVLRSKKLNGAMVGIMITASHNPHTDNGVKLVEPNGDMLVAEWENYAIQLANCNTPQELIDAVSMIRKKENINCDKALVGIGRDTRPSGLKLLEAVTDGVLIAGGDLKDFGVVTTPQCHYLVASSNAGLDPTCESYYKKLSEAWSIIVVSFFYFKKRTERSRDQSCF
jgi:phosphoacetylglucosamine mutase